MADDPEDAWRSSWLAVCARHAAGRWSKLDTACRSWRP